MMEAVTDGRRGEDERYGLTFLLLICRLFISPRPMDNLTETAGEPDDLAVNS